MTMMRLIALLMMVAPVSADVFCYEQFPPCRISMEGTDTGFILRYENEIESVLVSRSAGTSAGYNLLVDENTGEVLGKYRMLDDKTLLFNMELYHLK